LLPKNFLAKPNYLQTSILSPGMGTKFSSVSSALTKPKPNSNERVFMEMCSSWQDLVQNSIDACSLLSLLNFSNSLIEIEVSARMVAQDDTTSPTSTSTSTSTPTPTPTPTTSDGTNLVPLDLLKILRSRRKNSNISFTLFHSLKTDDPIAQRQIFNPQQFFKLFNLLRRLETCLVAGCKLENEQFATKADHLKSKADSPSTVNRKKINKLLENECCVCLDSSVDSVLSCSHAYCSKCIVKLRKRDLGCPCCRAKVAKVNDSWRLETWDEKDMKSETKKLEEEISLLLGIAASSEQENFLVEPHLKLIAATSPIIKRVDETRREF